MKVVCYGTLNAMRKATCKNGVDAMLGCVVDSPGKWNKENKCYDNEVRTIWYRDNAEANVNIVSALTSSLKVNEQYLFTYEQKDTFDIGVDMPVSSGVVSIPAMLNADATATDKLRFGQTLNAAIEAGFLPPTYVCGNEDLDALIATGKILSKETDQVAVDAVTALRRLVVPSQNLGIVQITKIYTADKYTKMQFAVKNGSKTEWRSVALFQKLKDKAAKEIEEGDTVMFRMSDPKEYKGKIEYSAYSFRVVRRPSDDAVVLDEGEELPY